MKILQIIPQLSSGGAERFVVDLSNELSQRHEVTLMVLHPLNENTKFYLPQVSPNVRVVPMNKKSGMDVGLYIKIFKFIRKEQPTVVHTHLRAILYILLSVLLCRFPKYFHTIHSDAAKEAGGKVGTFIRRLLFNSRAVVPVTISAESQQSFRDFYGIENAAIIPNGRNIPDNILVSDEVLSEVNTFKKGKTTRVLVCLARFEPVKRQDLLARVTNRLSKEGFDFILLYIGRMSNELVVSRTKQDKPDCAYLLGERENPLEYLKMADAYCLFSEHEGLPISLIEALGVGCIPVCTPVGGIMNLLIDGKNSVLSDDITEQSCYEALKRFLSLSDSEVSVMSREAKNSYKPFTMVECANNYFSLFKSY